jgi:hypothetical protein
VDTWEINQTAGRQNLATKTNLATARIGGAVGVHNRNSFLMTTKVR